MNTYFNKNYICCLDIKFKVSVTTDVQLRQVSLYIYMYLQNIHKDLANLQYIQLKF